MSIFDRNFIDSTSFLATVFITGQKIGNCFVAMCCTGIQQQLIGQAPPTIADTVKFWIQALTKEIIARRICKRDVQGKNKTRQSSTINSKINTLQHISKQAQAILYTAQRPNREFYLTLKSSSMIQIIQTMQTVDPLAARSLPESRCWHSAHQDQLALTIIFAQER